MREIFSTTAARGIAQMVWPFESFSNQQSSSSGPTPSSSQQLVQMGRQLLPFGLLVTLVFTSVKAMPLIFRWRHRDRVLRIREESGRLLLESLLSRRYIAESDHGEAVKAVPVDGAGLGVAEDDDAKKTVPSLLPVFYVGLNSVLPRMTKDDRARQQATDAAASERANLTPAPTLGPKRFPFVYEIAKDDRKVVCASAMSCYAALFEYKSNDILLVVDLWNVTVTFSRIALQDAVDMFEESVRNGEGGRLIETAPSILGWARLLKDKYLLESSPHFRRLLKRARLQIPGLVVEEFDKKVLNRFEEIVRAHRSYWAQLSTTLSVATSIISLPRLACSSVLIGGLYSLSSFIQSKNGVMRYSDLHGENELVIFAQAAASARGGVSQAVLRSMTGAIWRAVGNVLKMSSAEVVVSLAAAAISSYVMLDVNLLIETDSYMALAVQDLDTIHNYYFVYQVQSAIDSATAMSANVGDVLGSKVTSILSLMASAAYPIVVASFMITRKLMDRMYFSLSRAEFIIEFAHHAYGVAAQGMALRTVAGAWYEQMRRTRHHNPLFSEQLSPGDDFVDVDTSYFPQPALEAAAAHSEPFASNGDNEEVGASEHLRGPEDARVEWFASAPFRWPPLPTAGLALLVDVAVTSKAPPLNSRDMVWLQLCAQCHWPVAPAPLAANLYFSIDRVLLLAENFGIQFPSQLPSGSTVDDDVTLSRLVATRNALRCVVPRPGKSSKSSTAQRRGSTSQVSTQERHTSEKKPHHLPYPQIQNPRILAEMQKQLRYFGMDRNIAQLYTLQIRDSDETDKSGSYEDITLSSDLRDLMYGFQKTVAQAIGKIMYPNEFSNASHYKMETVQSDADNAASLLLTNTSRVYPWVNAECGEVYFDVMVRNYAQSESYHAALDLSSFQTIANVTARAQKIDRTHLKLSAGSDAGLELPNCCSLSVEFRDVTFVYKSGVQVLRNMSFCIAAGEFVGIVGETGGGKTTLLRLLLRLHEPTSGQILLNGRNIADYPVRQLRRRIAYVCQQACLDEETSIEANIAIGDLLQEDMTAAVDRALHLAEAADFVENLPLKIKTKGNGDQLSGGEQQRINIARALVKDSSRVGMYVLDEATSAIDVETERKIHKGIMSASSTAGEKITCVAIAHRLSTVRNADRIIVIDKGRIAQIGTWAELEHQVSEKPTIFQRLLAAQEVRGGVAGIDEAMGGMERTETTGSDSAVPLQAAASLSSPMSRSASRKLKNVLEAIIASKEPLPPDVKERAAAALAELAAPSNHLM